eukprot:g5234.t1
MIYKCKNCVPGYKKDGNKCEKRRCKCDHGKEAPQSTCQGTLTGSTQNCADGECYTGYHNDPSDKRRCKQNSCTCTLAGHGSSVSGYDDGTVGIPATGTVIKGGRF